MSLNDLNSAGLTRRQTLLAALSAAGLSACGGGGGTASVGTGGTGSFSAGPITGIGSIIVNGIRYDDSRASISSDDSGFKREDLRLGMVVAVQGTLAVDGRSSASRIVLGGELVGPISSISENVMVVLGQQVFVSDSTFYQGLGLGPLQVNDVIEVHGVAGPEANSITATYVEKKNGVNEYRIQGLVADHVGGNVKTFNIGTLPLNYAATDPDRIRVVPTNGVLVRVRLGTALTNGAYPVKRIRKPEDSYSGFSGEVEFKGTITTFNNTSSFTVNDLPVTASDNVYPEFRDKQDMKVGAYVEVKGSLVNGVLVATRVKLEDGPADSEFELHGKISNAQTSDTGGSFKLTSSGGVVVDVDWTNSISNSIFGGTVDNLIDERSVEVKGVLSNGNRVLATRIKIESN